jgi:hypothetical protein
LPKQYRRQPNIFANIKTKDNLEYIWTTI